MGRDPEEGRYDYQAVKVAILIAGAVAIVLAVCWPNKRMISRDIGCRNAAAGRSQEICNALSGSMEWTWMGHAIISPGWRVTWSGLRRVYCREKISAADVEVLKALARGSDWRLQDGAEDLIRLVGGGEPENSIFNPTNEHYILKGGCDAL
jgi:hypothetical protein